MKIRTIAILAATTVGLSGGLIACLQTENNAPETGDDREVETSTNGVFTKGEEIFTSEGHKDANGKLAKLSGAPYIGLIPKDMGAPCPYAAWFYLDDEDGSANNDQFFYGASDYSHKNYAVGGLAHTSSPWRAGGNSRISYCQEQVATLPRTKLDYAVISGSTTCPANGIRFGRRWDNEDGSNHNASGGEVDPNVISSGSNGYAWVYFCFVPKDDAATDLLPSSLSANYMFFTKNTPYYASFRTDDEDNNNNNQYTSSDGAYTTRMQALVSSGSNTWLQVGWVGSNPTQTDNGSSAGCGTQPVKPTCSDTPENSPNAGCTALWLDYNIKNAQYIGCTL